MGATFKTGQSSISSASMSTCARHQRTGLSGGGAEHFTSLSLAAGTPVSLWDATSWAAPSPVSSRWPDRGQIHHHSLRSGAATTLYRQNVDEQTIKEVTGHSSDAVRAYKRSDDSIKRSASAALCGVGDEVEHEGPAAKKMKKGPLSEVLKTSFWCQQGNGQQVHRDECLAERARCPVLHGREECCSSLCNVNRVVETHCEEQTSRKLRLELQLV